MTPRMPTSRPQTHTPGADLRNRTDQHTRQEYDQEDGKPHEESVDTDTEVRAMQLSTLIDQQRAQTDEFATGESIPCRDYDSELWFAERPDDVEFAKSLCGLCPVRAACLAGALQRAEPWGVWGGQLFVQGAVVARKRPRGRPRKHPVAA